MALITSILTGGSNNHQTTSEEANGVYTDFVSEGIVGSISNTSGVAPATGGLAVNAQGTPDMTVAVSSGVCYVNGTPTSQNNQTFRIKNTASSNVTISANASGSTKYDWIYLKLDADKLNTPNTAGDDVATLVASRSSSAASDDGTPPTYGYPLAVVTVANGASSISNGNIRDIRGQVALNTGSSNAQDGWVSLSNVSTFTVSSGYNKGNKEYELNSSANLTGVLSPGARFKITRGTTPPTQCSDLEASSSQYASLASASVTGVTFTDDFTIEAWIKLESYSAGAIASRYNGTSGFQFYINATGQLILAGNNGGSGNYSQTLSNQSLPLGQWTHVAAVLDMSTFTSAASPIYINGASVPVTVSRAGTNPTALVQAGNLQVGAVNAGTFLDGKIADVRIWSAARTATQIRDNMNQQLVGNETNLVAYYKLNGDFNDSTSNANNLTGSGGAVATDTDSPMNSTEYAIVTKVTSTTVTVFTGLDNNIPNLTLSTPHYSTARAPFGFPSSRNKWVVASIYRAQFTQGSASSGTWYNLGSQQCSVPIGDWNIMFSTSPIIQATTASILSQTLSTANSTESNVEHTGQWYNNASSTTGAPMFKNRHYSNSAQTIYYLNTKQSGGSSVTLYNMDSSVSIIQAECAYL